MDRDTKLNIVAFLITVAIVVAGYFGINYLINNVNMQYVVAIIGLGLMGCALFAVMFLFVRWFIDDILNLG